jgi:hypothetical protein
MRRGVECTVLARSLGMALVVGRSLGMALVVAPLVGCSNASSGAPVSPSQPVSGALSEGGIIAAEDGGGTTEPVGHDDGGGAPTNGPVADDAGAGTMASVPMADAGGTGVDAAGAAVATVGKVFWLAIVGNQVETANDDGTAVRTLVSAQGISAPDGVGVDVAGGKMYWTNMGTLTDSAHTPAGSLQRANLDGSQVEVLFKPGATTNTPKQLQLDLVHRKIYWSDREGAKAWRSNLDGTGAEVLLSGHGIMQLVGMALDIPKGQFYVTDRYAKTILRAGFDMPSGATDSTRTDVEQLYLAQGSAMPIDLDLDLGHRVMYWTDRGIGTVQSAGMDLPSGQTASNRTDVKTLISNLSTPIGISLDLAAGHIYYTELAGPVFRANLDGTGGKSIGNSSGASGIAHVEMPVK